MKSTSFPVIDFQQTKDKVLNWAQRFSTFCFLDNHQYQLQPHSQECILAAGIRRSITATAGTALSRLQAFLDEKGSWVFGHLSYDLKNEIEELQSLHNDPVGFPDLFFFEPEILIRLSPTAMMIDSPDPASVFTAILSTEAELLPQPSEPVNIRQRLSAQQYREVIDQLRIHIKRGDCYEINFCQDFFAEDARLYPLAVYRKLSHLSPNPFSALYRVDDRWLICASPERFLQKQGNRILSQPMKGTSKREINNREKDEKNKDQLLHSAKDRSENVMIVDLVRNDLAKICKQGTVKVDELYGIYSFPQVHQMVSTISGELAEGVSFREVIRATFPMGSMTGAPKKRVMELIEQLETTRRGIFSGALGYISPAGDFDFNVVIRSIMYNAAAGYLSYKAGSGITFYSDPRQEWEECLLKAEAIKKVLEAAY